MRSITVTGECVCSRSYPHASATIEFVKPRRLNELPEHAAECLVCACSNPDNGAARRLLRFTHARSRLGVLAAAFVASAEDWIAIVQLTRTAIAEQRHHCTELRARHSRTKICRRDR